MMRTAANLGCGEKARIGTLNFDHPSARRIIECGFTPGQEIEIVNKAFFDDPIAIAVRGAIIAIRKNEAESIILE